MRLKRVFTAMSVLLLILVGAMLSQILLAQVSALRSSEEGLRAIEVAAKAMVAAEKASAERGPSNGVLGDSDPPDAAKEEKLAEARATSDRALTDVTDALRDDPSAAMQQAARVIERARAKLQLARGQVDRVAGLSPAMRSDERVMDAVHAMFDVIPMLMEAVTILSREAEARFPEFSAAMVRARLAAELREYAGRLGSQFTGAVTHQQPLAPRERRQIDILRGRIEQLRSLIEMPAPLDRSDDRIRIAIDDVEARYFGDGLGFVEDVVRLSDANRPYGIDTSELAGRYVPDMGSIVQLRDVLLDVAVHRARRAHSEALRRLSFGLAAGVSSLVLVALLYLVVRWRVVTPLVATTRALIDLAAGRMQEALPPHARPDEIGDVMRAVEVLRQSSLERQRLEVERQQLMDELEKMSKTDFLTGILNRRAFLESANIQMGNARRYGWPMTIIQFDLDHFKRVNDVYGHGTGDAVLVEVARVAAQQLRQGDFLARYGGEEFAVLAVQCEWGMARQLAERMRAAIEAAVVPNGEGKLVQVTASFGVACALQPDAVLEELLQGSDRALYAAKESGRNRVVVDGA